MAASLTECGFMDPSTDIQFVLDPKWSKRIALGIAEGITLNGEDLAYTVSAHLVIVQLQ